MSIQLLAHCVFKPNHTSKLGLNNLHRHRVRVLYTHAPSVSAFKDKPLFKLELVLLVAESAVRVAFYT